MRQLKTFDQLRALMIRDTLRHKHLCDLQPRLVALPERDASGCNWAVDGWVTSKGVEREQCTQLQALVKACQLQFNAVGRSPGNAMAILLPVSIKTTDTLSGVDETTDAQ
jgi:hypothetical protein